MNTTEINEINQAGAERFASLEYCFAKQPDKVEQILQGAELIRERTGIEQHDLLVVLGSGLVDTAQDLGEVRATIALRELPLVNVPAAEGHGTDLVSVDVTVDGVVRHVLVSTGRIHLYEGYSPAEVCALAQIGAMTGVKTAFLTNAGGCLRDWTLGDVMAIADHVNLSGSSPFDGPVFVDIMHLWDAQLTTAIAEHTQRKGVYAILRGPEFQTYTESVRMRESYIDMVGMSTVMEAIALHQLGVRVCGVSVTSDLSFDSTPTEHSQVLKAVQGALPRVQECIKSVLRNL